MSSPKRFLGIGAVSVVAMVALAFAPAAQATAVTPASTALAFAFPSSSSTVIASTGFIDACQIGYFWSVSRGDSVSQTFLAMRTSTHAVLDLDVVQNALSPGNHVDWNVVINSQVVGSFSIASGVTGHIHLVEHYAQINGKSYAVALKVTNEVVPGGGSVTLSYADCGGPHQIRIKKT